MLLLLYVQSSLAIGNANVVFKPDNKRTAFDPQAIVEQIYAGDARGEHTLIEHYAPALKLILQRRYQDEQLRQDVFQDTFRILIETIRNRTLENPKALASFLQSTATNLAREYIYQENRHRVIDQVREVEQVISQEYDAQKQLENKELVEYVRAVTQSMETDRDRLILIRFYLEEEDKALICKQLDLESAHFDRVLYRAKQRLRKLMEKSGRDR